MRPPKQDLPELCSEFFLFITTFRRNAKTLASDVRWLKAHLTKLVDDIENRAASDPDLKRNFEQAKYPLVALADEVALNTEWVGQNEWEEELLEEHYFSTSIAGEEFFNRLDALKPEDSELSEIYFLCLSLGFKGAYKRRPEERRELAQNLHSKLPDRIHKKTDSLCPKAYDYTVERDMTKLPAVSAAYIGAILLGAVILAFFASRVLTTEILEDLNDQATTIHSKESQG